MKDSVRLAAMLEEMRDLGAKSHYRYKAKHKEAVKEAENAIKPILQSGSHHWEIFILRETNLYWYMKLQKANTTWRSAA